MPATIDTNATRDSRQPPFRRWFRAALCWCCSLSILTGCAATTTLEANAPAIWKVIPGAAPETIVAQIQDDHAVISVLCLSDGCRILVVSSTPCEANTLVPVLVNTAVESGITTGNCVPSELPEPEPARTGAIYLNEPNVLLPQIILGDKTTIAVPSVDGRIVVYTIPMAGLRSLMESVKPDVFDFPDAPDDGLTNPFGLPEPPGLNQDQIDRWRRDLESVEAGASPTYAGINSQ